MKFLILLAVIAAASAVPHQRFLPSEISDIISAINSPSTHPATAAALQQMLQDLLSELGLDAISVGPAIIDNPALIDTNPALVEEHEDISVGPALIEDQPANYPSYKGPLVQVIVNVDSSSADGVTVDQVYSPEYPALIPSPVDIIDGSQPELVPDNINVIDNEIIPDAISIVENPKPELEADNISIDTPVFPDAGVILPAFIN